MEKDQLHILKVKLTFISVFEDAFGCLNMRGAILLKSKLIRDSKHNWALPAPRAPSHLALGPRLRTFKGPRALRGGFTRHCFSLKKTSLPFWPFVL